MDRITIRAFRAAEEPKLSSTYVEEHARVLRDVGVLDSLPQDHGWCLEDDCIVVVAEHPTLGMVGGCRLQMAKPGRPMPFELHLRPLEEHLTTKTAGLLSERCAELCGLWVAHRFAGHGLPWFLTAAAVSLAIQLPVDSLVCLAAEYSMDYACRNGFIRMLEVGDGGAFTFPTPDIRSFALINNEPIGLGYARMEERQRLISLRLNPNQARVELMKEKPFEVYYSLKLQQKVIPFQPYLSREEQARRRSA
jgi:hypothetical protein